MRLAQGWGAGDKLQGTTHSLGGHRGKGQVTSYLSSDALHLSTVPLQINVLQAKKKFEILDSVSDW